MSLRPNRRLSFASIVACAVVLSGCGGGGGGGSALRPFYIGTAEYAAQEGLRLIDASSIYARGGAGEGVTVAVFDGGASPDHPDLAGTYVYIGGVPGLSPIDGDGHGTHVGGIIAANRNGHGMHGVAWGARLASYRTQDSSGRGVGTDRDLADGIDEMRARAILVTNNSWGSGVSILDRTRSQIEVEARESLAAYRDYVGADGVQVWAAGNQGDVQVTWRAGAPYRFPELEDGWLTVMAIDLNGREASYTNRCGVAAAWCLAAPGGDFGAGVYSTAPGGVYARYVGTSQAAPHVAGALAALKSLFPNLSYHDLRDRLLVTANDRGVYANRSIFGQGLLDLDAASRPVGGTSFALGAWDRGPVATTAGATVALPRAAASRYLAGRHMLVLDNYQRAPFPIPADAFAEAAGAYLSLADLDLATPEWRWDEGAGTATLAVAGDGFRAGGASNGVWFVGSGRGARVMEGMAHLVGVPLPHGDYRMADDALGVTLGLASGEGEFYAGAATGAADRTGDDGFGVVGWNPETVLTASFVPNGAVEAFGASVASALKRPMGWAGAGALELSGDSFDLAYARRIASGEAWRLGLASRLTHLATESGPLVRFDDALMAATELDLSLDLGAETTLNARLGMERPVTSSKGSIRAASGIDESGRIGYDDIVIDGSDFLAFDKIGLRVRHALRPDAILGAGVMAVRDGFGQTEAIAAALAEFHF